MQFHSVTSVSFVIFEIVVPLRLFQPRFDPSDFGSLYTNVCNPLSPFHSIFLHIAPRLTTFNNLVVANHNIHLCAIASIWSDSCLLDRAYTDVVRLHISDPSRRAIVTGMFGVLYRSNYSVRNAIHNLRHFAFIREKIAILTVFRQHGFIKIKTSRLIDLQQHFRTIWESSHSF